MCGDDALDEDEFGGAGHVELDEQRFTSAEVANAELQIVEQSKRIDFYITEYSLELLANKMRNGDFVIPDYQRAFTWGSDRKTRFLESLLMNLPIPFLVFWENPVTGQLEIVDGSQRLRTIVQFLHEDLQLGDLEQLSRLTGFRFSDLPEGRQRKLKNRSIRGIILNEHADDQARFDLFDRINTGSLAANKAEVRRGALGGPFLEMVISLAQDNTFKKLAPMSQAQVDLREDEELVTRFFAYGDGLEGYQDRVSPFLYAYTKRMNVRFASDLELVAQYEARFRRTMQFVDQRFPFGFRRNSKGRATPRARFEAIAIGSDLALREDPNLALKDGLDVGWVEQKEFATVAGSGSANAINKLRGRIAFVRNKLLGA